MNKILISGITMASAGTERAFLSFARELCGKENDITLLLAKKSGGLLGEVPDEIKICEMRFAGELFTMSGKNAKGVLMRALVRKHPVKSLALLRLLPNYISKNKRKTAAMRIWLVAMRACCPRAEGKYDEAIAYWGDKTMFYVADKVSAKKKTAWLHFEYDYPERDDELYGEYFAKFDEIVCVSQRTCAMLREKFPESADKFSFCPIKPDAKSIAARASEPCPETAGDFLKILSVGRVNPVKGYDIAMPAVAGLIKNGCAARWYIVGLCDDEAYLSELKREAARLGIEENIVFVGEADNPYKYMKNCDVCIQPSRSESYGLAVSEELLLGKKVICTDIPSARGSENCILCEPRSEDFAKELSKIAKNRCDMEI